MKKLLLLGVLFLGSASLSAHHGIEGQFDRSKSVSLDGTVTGIRFVNPHAYLHLDVEDADGVTSNWACELRSAAVLTRSGWSAELFPVGTAIHIDGAPDRRDPLTCYVETITFVDSGMTLARYQQLQDGDIDFSERRPRTAYGVPNLNGNWASPQFLGDQAPGGPAGMGFSGEGSLGQGVGQVDGELTEAAQNAIAEYDWLTSGRFHCGLESILSDWAGGSFINRIEQTESQIRITLGRSEAVRVIHLDQNAHPEPLGHSSTGHSIGRWEGDELVVETAGLNAGSLRVVRNVLLHSDQLTVVERFSYEHEARRLRRSYIAEDPLYFTGPYIGSDTVYLTSTPFLGSQCGSE